MPLLKKKTLEKAQVDEFLRDDEEVFHCVMTNEIFRDYDEFAERTILCNSMVWTCSMTGKSNLTYEEALESEENAKQLLKEFPTELHIPTLYIATLVKCSLTDMVDEVFNYMKDRYFIGEKVDVLIEKKWKECTVINVILPTDKETSDSKTKSDGMDASNLYKYEVKDESDSTKHICTQIKRKKGMFTRDKTKLFLKQHVEVNGSLLGIKKSALELFGIVDMKFDQIFAGPPPTFEHKVKTASANGKKVRQETLAKFLSKNNIMVSKTKEGGLDLTEIAANKKEARELRKEKEREKRQQEKETKKQRHIEISMKIRDWNNPVNDLLLEDHKVLPVPTPLKSRIPDKYMGEVLALMEFFHTFSSVLSTRTFFSGGVPLTTMEKILMENRIGGPMENVVHMLLVTLFKLEALEKEQYSNKLGGRWAANKETLQADRCQLWLLKNYGSTLYNMEIDTCTLSELLRLHLLCSGNNISEAGMKWRAQYRGGFESDEDPAIQFRQHNPHILKMLSLHHVCQLPLVDKLKLLDCLVSQLLTYKEIRDVIDDNLEKMKEQKDKLRVANANKRKHQTNIEAQIVQLKRGNFDLSPESAKRKISKVRETLDDDNRETDAQMASIQKEIYRKAHFLGYDRAFRAYIKLHSVPAFAVNQEDHQQGSCLAEITHHVPELVGADKEGILKYLKRISDVMNSSDKENEPKLNGVELKSSSSLATINELMMCTTDPTSCPVHTISSNTLKWQVFTSEEQLQELLDSLNRRGLNEKALAKCIEFDFINLTKVINKTPAYVIDGPPDLPSRFHKEDNWGYEQNMSVNEVLRSTVIDRILNLEEKLFDGYLGGIQTDREEFRSLVEDNKYKEIEALTRPETKWQLDDDEDEPKQISAADWEDPGKYLAEYAADVDSEDSEVESDEILLAHSKEDQNSVRFLAYALAQVALSIKLNFVAKPLGQFKDSRVPKRSNAIVMWERSLLDSTSYSQILLHLHILDSHIAWTKSMLVVKCKACKRGTNEQNILLCDYCNDGYHIYCLRPKLSSIPDGNWYCVTCKEIVQNEEARKKQKLEDEQMEVDSDVKNEPQDCIICGVTASEDSVVCSTCLNSYHLECTGLKRGVRGAWTCTVCKDNAAEREAAAQGTPHQTSQRRSGRSNETNDDLPLNNAALQELLKYVINLEDSWPFIKPVQKNAVPDYHEVIKKPMDFGTIKYKLNMGVYQYDEECLYDCQLVFENCHTYNSSGDDVYQCGSRLLKYFTKKCKELKLDFDISITMETDDDADESFHQPPRKTKRTR